MGLTRPQHLSDTEWKAIQDYLSQVHQIYPGEVIRIVLYGSKARGDDDVESDIDLFVVLTDKNGERHKQLEDATYDIDLKYDVVLSDLIVDVKRWSWMEQHREPLIEHINDEGIVLWTMGEE